MRRLSRGFSLIELITVMVVLAIVGTVGISFFVSFLKTYNDAQARTKLISKGRVVMEQVSRHVRNAVPYSVRISSSGSCLEFLPIVAAATYVREVPNTSHDYYGAVATSSLTTSPFTTDMGTGRHIVIGAFSSSDIYTTANPAGRVSITALSGGPFTTVNFNSSHVFTLNSDNGRAFIADNPVRYCYFSATQQFLRYTDYGLDTGAMSDAVPTGATTALMADDVSASASVFSLSAGSQDRSVLVSFNLTFSQLTQTVPLNNKILIRNVP